MNVAKAKAKGRLRGEQPKLNHRQEHLVLLMHSGDCSTADVAQRFRVGRSTVYRAIERQSVAGKAGLGRGGIETLGPRVPAVPNPTPHRDAGERVGPLALNRGR